MLAHATCPLCAPMCPLHAPLHTPYAPPMRPLHAPYVPLHTPYMPLMCPLCTPYMPPMCPLCAPKCPYLASDWLRFLNIPTTANQITGIDQAHYRKILIFFPTTSLKCLHAARIDELADSNKPATSYFVFLLHVYNWVSHCKISNTYMCVK